MIKGKTYNDQNINAYQNHSKQLERGPMHNVMAALPNIGGALCATPQFGGRLLLECRAVTLPRCETRWNLLGCAKLPNRSQPLVSRSSPYCGNIWRRYGCLTSFFPIVDTCLSCEDIVIQSCAMVPRWRIFGHFLHPVFSASHVQHVSDLRPKFALRPHHAWKYGRHPICDGWDYARKEKR